MKLILVRHGNTFETGEEAKQVGSRTDLPLTATGKKQARQMGDYLLSHNLLPTAIFTGPLVRQTESAQIIAQQLSIPTVLQEPALTEIDYGLWEGLSSAAISSRWPTEHANWTHAGIWPSHIFEGSEEKHLANIKRWLTQLRCTYEPQDILLAISSNGIMRYFCNQRMDFASCNKTEQLKVKTGHFCILELTQEYLHTHLWNQNPASTPSQV